MSLPSRLLVFAVCGSAGYFAAAALAPDSAGPDFKAKSGEAKNEKASRPPLTGRLESSVLVSEWERMKREQGGDFGVLYSAIKDLQDPYRRRAFRSALIAEWAMTNPQAGLAYLLEKDGSMASQLAREWMRIDANATISTLLGDAKGINALRPLLSDIADLMPQRLAEVLSKLPPTSSRWDTSTADLFTRLAEKDLVSARAIAESVTGSLRAQALAGIANAWAQKAGPDAFAWADSLPVGETRESAMRAALVGWAKTDPVAALSKIDAVPPGGEEGYFASDTGARVLREAARKDWDATVKWLSENPGKLGMSSFQGLQDALSDRLVKDTGATMRELEKWQMPALSQVLANSVLNQGYAARDAIWAWLDGRPSNAFTQGVRGSLLNAIAWKEPAMALEFLEKLRTGPEDTMLLQQGTRSLLNGGQQFHRVEELLEKASPHLRPFLLQAAFEVGSGELGSNPERWVKRLDELPEGARPNALGGLARGWASADPEAAKDWALGLSNPTERNSAINSVAHAWAAADLHGAAAWVNTLDKGATRDGATQSLVYAVSQSQPHAAWPWALSIEAKAMRLSALQFAYQAMRQKDPGSAEQMLQSPELAPEEISELKKAAAVPGRAMILPY